MNIIYRRATPVDVDLLTNTRLNLLREDSGPMTESESNMLYQSNKEHMVVGMDNSSFFSYLAFDDDIFIGTCSVCLYSVLPGRKLPNGKHAYIQNTYVVPAYRGKGIAKRLVSMAVNEALSMGYKNISLHATEMGRLLFNQCGFKETGNINLTLMEYHQ